MFYYVIILPIALFLLAYKFIFTSKTHRFNLPPSPPNSFPILGHHRLLKPLVHSLFHRLSKTHGPIFSLHFGSRRAVVISSSSLATECFTGKNDIVLSNRPCFLTAKYVAYNYTTVGTAPYGDYWRNFHRIFLIYPIGYPVGPGRNASKCYRVDYSTAWTRLGSKATTLAIPSLGCLPTKYQGANAAEPARWWTSGRAGPGKGCNSHLHA